MIKHIIREVEPEACSFDYYFDGDTFTERAGDYCYTLFIVGDRHTAVFNAEAWECGEIWLGCGKEFCVIDVEDYAEDEDGEATYTETDSVYGYIVADSQAWRDEDYKRLVCEWAGINEEETRLEMIDGSHVCTTYSYRVA